MRHTSIVEEAIEGRVNPQEYFDFEAR